MPAQFDLGTTQVTQFGVGIDADEGPRFVLVPVDGEVQAVLRQMVAATRSAMENAGEPERYQPSEKHGAHENLNLPLDDGLATTVRAIHEAQNLPAEPKALKEPRTVFCYFTRLGDGKGNHLTAVRRASSFKGVLESQLLSLLDDSLRIVEDDVFKLDEDFDFLIDAAGVHILRAAGFESIGKLRDEIMNAAPTNIKAIQADMGFVDFGPIEVYALKHPRAARYLASIRLQQTKNIDKTYLKKHCINMKLDVKEVKGRLVVAPEAIMDFLAVLDRRLYQVELVKDTPESFRAGSRSKIVTPAAGAK
jgi:hypothetical protein